MGRVVLGMNYDSKPKRRGQSLTLPHHLRGVTLFISRIISSTHIHFLIPILIINMQRIFTCSSGSVRLCAGKAHVQLKSSPQTPLAQPWEVLSTHPSMATLPLSYLASPRPLLFQIIEGQCSVFKEKRGKKRAPVSKLCLFADGMSKKKHPNKSKQARKAIVLLRACLLVFLNPFPPSLPFLLPSAKVREVRWEDRWRLLSFFCAL